MAPTFVPRSGLSVDDIDLSDIEFWALPEEEREGAFATLRRERPISFHEERDFGVLPQGPGYWALSRHRDVLDASRQPELFCSGKGSNIGDMPEPFLDFFGSMALLGRVSPDRHEGEQSAGIVEHRAVGPELPAHRARHR